MIDLSNRWQNQAIRADATKILNVKFYMPKNSFLTNLKLS